MPRLIAAIPTNLQRTPLGLPSLLSQRIAGRTVLAHTVARVARVKGIEAIVLIHPAGQDPLPLLEGYSGRTRIETLAVSPDPPDEYGPMRAAARPLGAACLARRIGRGDLLRRAFAREADL